VYPCFDPEDLDNEDCESASLALEARHLVLDYYGTAWHSGMFAAGGNLDAAQQMSDTQIIEEARRLGLL